VRKFFGARRARLAIRKARKFRRPFYRGNPVPALVAGLASKLVGGLFKAPSEKRAAKVAPAVILAANAGNLTAVAGLLERAAKPMRPKESLVWKLAAAQLSARVKKAAMDYATLIPPADQSNPENFAASVLAQPVSLAELEAQAKEARAAAGSAAERRAARAAAASDIQAGRLTELGVAGLQALAGRGRRPATRRRRRSTKGRAFSF